MLYSGEAGVLDQVPPMKSGDLSVKVDFLRQPNSYPHPVTHVEVMETHMSWVFLTDTIAYKLKKPVTYDFLDFSTVALRKHWCDEELRLNRRLAHDVYLDVTPLTETAGSGLRIGGSGQVVDWLVKMRRLPDHRMLNHAIIDGTFSERDIPPVASLLARFYRQATSVTLQPDDYRLGLKTIIEDNQRELIRYASEYLRPVIDSVTAAQLEFLTCHAEAFDRRVLGGHIVEGHGDLRPEHIYLGPPPRIIDCLEFNFDLRIVDPADELAALAMECERLGAVGVGDILFETYIRITKDNPPPSLFLFHKGLRACTRAKLAVWHLKDAVVKTPEKWLDQATSYLEIASMPVPDS
jgi:aminoglycoside phosphotransferase family enzyme